MDYPRLPRFWKNRYPFRLACPSYVYPADYDVNVELLGPHVDDIELLFFESRPATRPGQDLIRRLMDLGRRHAVGYHVHLPTDLALFDVDENVQQTAVDTLADMAHRFRPLQPAFVILHLEMPGGPDNASGDRRGWERRIARGLERIRIGCPALPPIKVENQSVPLEWIDPLLAAFDLTLCLDIGHLILTGVRLEEALARWHSHISALHVHGVTNGKDHRSLAHLAAGDQGALTTFLHAFQGSVSAEVFSFQALCESLLLIEKWMD